MTANQKTEDGEIHESSRIVTNGNSKEEEVRESTTTGEAAQN